MDGYAVVAPIDPGVYKVVQRVYGNIANLPLSFLLLSNVKGSWTFLAGDSPPMLERGSIAYITTGAKLPPGADAVVKIGTPIFLVSSCT